MKISFLYFIIIWSLAYFVYIKQEEVILRLYTFALLKLDEQKESLINGEYKKQEGYLVKDLDDLLANQDCYDSYCENK